MNKPPPGWPRLSSGVYYEDPAAAITFLEKAFGFVTRIRVDGPDGKVVHSELLLDEALVMVGPAKAERHTASPSALGGLSTHGLFIYIDDVDAHCAHARAAGAKIVQEPTDVDYGPEYWSDRNYQAADPEGHRWMFAQRLRTGG